MKKIINKKTLLLLSLLLFLPLFSGCFLTPSVNQAPTITSTPITTATVAVAYAYTVNATDSDEDTLTYSLTTSPTGMTIDSTTGVISWMPTSTQQGNHSVTVVISDGALSATQSFTIIVSKAAIIHPLTPTVVPVSAITITGTGNATTITTYNGTLQMLAAVTPTNATNQNVTWLVTNGTGTATISAGGLLTAVTNGTVTVKATSVSTGTVNGTLVITISNQVVPNEEQLAPTGLAGVAPTTYGGTDGKITGTTTAMEYKLSSASDYTPATVTEITGLAAGTYQVRYAAKTGYNTGTAADVVVPALAIGHSYGGGKVAYILVSGDPGYSASVQHGLIAATADQSTSIVWHATNDGEIGTTATELGTGNANTNAIIALYGTESNAAKLCADYSITVDLVTYNDWYLPSWNELNKLYAMKVLGFGGFASNNYWSSSEFNSGTAFALDLTGGTIWLASKNSLNIQVRAIRSF